MAKERVSSTAALGNRNIFDSANAQGYFWGCCKFSNSLHLATTPLSILAALVSSLVAMEKEKCNSKCILPGHVPLLNSTKHMFF